MEIHSTFVASYEGIMGGWDKIMQIPFKTRYRGEFFDLRGIGYRIDTD